MNEIEKSNSSSDVSSNSSWTFLDDVDKNNKDNGKINVESLKEPENIYEVMSSNSHTRIRIEAESKKPLCENEKVKDDVKAKLTAKKPKNGKSKSAPFNLYNTLPNKNCIGTLTIVGTVLALTGLSFLCLLLPTNNPSCMVSPNSMVNVSSFNNSSPTYTCPIYQNDGKSLIIDDSNGILVKKLKEIVIEPKNAQNTNSISEESKMNLKDNKLTDVVSADIQQYPQTYEDFVASNAKPKKTKEQDEVINAVVENTTQDKEVSKNDNNLSSTGRNNYNYNNINIKNYAVFSTSKNLQQYPAENVEETKNRKDESTTEHSFTKVLPMQATEQNLENSKHQQKHNIPNRQHKKLKSEIENLKPIKGKELQSGAISAQKEIKRQSGENSKEHKQIDIKKTTKADKNFLNNGKREENRKKCNIEYMNRRSTHSTTCCGRNSFFRQKPLERRPCPRRNETVRIPKSNISNSSTQYTEFLLHYPNLNVILRLCQDILLLKMLNRLRGTTDYTNIKKKIESTYRKVNESEDDMEGIESVESIADVSLKRLFEEEDNVENSITNDSSNRRSSSLCSLKRYREKSEDESIVLQNPASTLYTSKCTCKCYKNHARPEVPSKKVRKMLENYEKMITSSDNKEVKSLCAKDNETNVISHIDTFQQIDKKTSICLDDSYECECKFEDSKLIKAEINESVPKSSSSCSDCSITFQTTLESECTIIKQRCQSNNLESTHNVNSILDQIVCDALENLRDAYLAHKRTCDSSDDQNQADDERSSDSESDSKCSESAPSNTPSSKTSKSEKSENMNYFLLFGKSKSQLKKKDVKTKHSKEQQLVSKKKLVSKQQPGKGHVERTDKHYRILQ